ncbi:hypothetical protein EJ110_NYTH26703 [Nymphaea thermarum]|nr:hypothetical protein EJ110_NYTH26703 [Nymphaea thermarum]
MKKKQEQRRKYRRIKKKDRLEELADIRWWIRVGIIPGKWSEMGLNQGRLQIASKMTFAWRPLPPQDHDHLLENTEVIAPLSVQVPRNASHSDAEESVRGESSAGQVDDREKDCCCQTSGCRCSARTGLFAVQCSACFKWRLIPSKRV